MYRNGQVVEYREAKREDFQKRTTIAESHGVTFADVSAGLRLAGSCATYVDHATYKVSWQFDNATHGQAFVHDAAGKALAEAFYTNAVQYQQAREQRRAAAINERSKA